MSMIFDAETLNLAREAVRLKHSGEGQYAEPTEEWADRLARQAVKEEAMDRLGRYGLAVHVQACEKWSHYVETYSGMQPCRCGDNRWFCATAKREWPELTGGTE